MNYSLLMRMLYCVADLNKQFQTGSGRQGMLVAVIGDFDALDQFHHKIRPAALGGARIEYVSDVRMVHQRECLSLGLKACNHAFCIHSRFNDLESDSPADRLLLFCYK